MIEGNLRSRFKQALLDKGLLKQAAAIEPSSLAAEDDVVLEQPETLEELLGRMRSDEKKDHPLHAGNLFQHFDAHPYVLGFCLLQRYGTDWMEWESEVITARILNDFKTNSVSDLTMDKIEAVRSLHYSDWYWERWEVFIAVTMPFNNLLPDFEVMQVPTVMQCALSVHIANKIRNDMAWSDEMKAYLGVVHKFDGIMCAVDPLDFVVVDSEQHPVDTADVLKRWPAVRDSGKAPTHETVEDEQLRRLLAVHQAIQESDKRQQTQLRMVFRG